MANVTVNGTNWYDEFSRVFNIVSAMKGSSEIHDEILDNKYFLATDGQFSGPTQNAGTMTTFGLYDVSSYNGDIVKAFYEAGDKLQPYARKMIEVRNLSIDVSTVTNASGAGLLGTVLSGNDAITGSDSADLVYGMAGNDTAFGGGGNDYLAGNAGMDVLYGNAGNDTLYGGIDNDSLYGGVDNDLLNGNLGDDVVNGNLGNDTVRGGQGNDQLFGGQGEDELWGDMGNDTLSGDRGNDTLTGGGGADLFTFAAGSGIDVITDFNAGEGDRIGKRADVSWSVSAGASGAVITFSTQDQVILTGVSADQVTASLFVAI